MPQTGAERNKKYREKIKSNATLSAAYKEKDKQRKKESRKNNICSPRKAAIEKNKVRDRVRLHRLKKKLAAKAKSPTKAEQMESEHPYKTPQSLGKAVKKVTRQLPKSPRKRKAVISKIAEAAKPIFNKPTEPNANNHIPVTTIEEVKEFYFHDSISRQSPGQKDFVISRNNGKKSKLQKRYLIWSLKETFGMFQQEHPHTKIGLSKFCSLRPVNVLLKSSTPREVCLCQYHDNIKMLCDTLSKEIPTFPSYSRSFVDNFVCDSNKEECMTGKCQKCPNWFETMKDTSLNLEEVVVQWGQWERVSQTEKGKDGKTKAKKMVRILKEGTLEEALQDLESKIPFFLEHVFIQRKQSSYFEECKTQLKSNEAVVQVDFAENYSCQYQDEIQAAHWCQEQVTLFTVAIWAKDPNDETICSTHVIVSDDHSHEKRSIAVFIDKVVNELISDKFPNVQQVHIFSDGPSSQFKNKYMASFYSILQRKGLSIQWNFFATSHGKGVVDGLGGTVKRVVREAVLTRKVSSVLNAKEFAEAAESFCKSIKITCCLKEDILKSSEKLALDKCFSKAKPIAGIKRLHCIEPTLKGRLYSSQPSVQTSNYTETLSDSSYTDTESEGTISDEYENDDLFDGSFNEDSNSIHEDVTVTINASPTINKANIHIDLGLPQTLKTHANDICSDFVNLPHMEHLVEMIANEKIPFGGDQLITNVDIRSLYGNSPSIQGRWLSNFVIDGYFKLLKTSLHSSNDLKVEVLSWEEFERSVGSTRPIDTILQGKEKLLEQDLILIPCNTQGSLHWFLLVVYPKQQSIVVYDSLAGSCVKPTWQHSVGKMMGLLQAVDKTVDCQKWTFKANKNNEIPQQTNAYDCGVFVCLFARCLAHKTKMVPSTSIPVFRKIMIFELCFNMLQPIPPSGICQDEYYAVHYVSNYYIGRVLEKDGDFVKFKFLHRVGAHVFGWPKRDDVDSPHTSCIFFGPVELLGNGPFQVPWQSVIEKVFKA